MINKSLSAEPEFSKYLHSVARKKGLPVSGTFELTSRCNFACKMCYIHSQECNKKKSAELPAEWWIETGKQAAEQGMIFLLLTGGEPLLREDFPVIYSELKKLGLIITINTNGYLLDEKTAEIFKTNPPNRLNISLYGADEITYEKVTGVRGFQKVISNIELMRSLGIDVRLNCSITRDNCGNMEDIFRLAERMKLHIKTTPYMYPQTRIDGRYGNNTNRLSPEDAAKCRVKWSRLKYEHEEFMSRAAGMKKGIETFEKDCIEVTESGKVRCRAGSSSFWINKDGEMSPCGIINKSFDVKKSGFAEAWEKVRSFTASIELPKECQSCKYRHFCNVCAAVCLTETGDFSKKPEYVCQFSKETARLTQIEFERLEKIYGN